MKIRFLAVLAATLFVLLESQATSQTLGSTLSLPYNLRASGEFTGGGVVGKTGNIVLFAPPKAKRVKICVDRGAAGPTTICIRQRVGSIAPNTCKTYYTNREVTRIWGVKLPKRTKLTLKLPTGVTNTSGWVHFLNT